MIPWLRMIQSWINYFPSTFFTNCVIFILYHVTYVFKSSFSINPYYRFSFSATRWLTGFYFRYKFWLQTPSPRLYILYSSRSIKNLISCMTPITLTESESGPFFFYLGPDKDIKLGWSKLKFDFICQWSINLHNGRNFWNLSWNEPAVRSSRTPPPPTRLFF